MDCKEIREMYKLMFAEYPDIVTVKDLQAMLGISRHAAYDLLGEGEISCIRLGNAYKIPKINVINLQQAQKSAAVWKQRYEKIYDKYQELKKEVQPYLDAVKLAPQKVRAFLDAILTRTRQTRQHDQPVHRKSQDMEL